MAKLWRTCAHLRRRDDAGLLSPQAGLQKTSSGLNLSSSRLLGSSITCDRQWPNMIKQVFTLSSHLGKSLKTSQGFDHLSSIVDYPRVLDTHKFRQLAAQSALSLSFSLLLSFHLITPLLPLNFLLLLHVDDNTVLSVKTIICNSSQTFPIGRQLVPRSSATVVFHCHCVIKYFPFFLCFYCHVNHTKIPVKLKAMI